MKVIKLGDNTNALLGVATCPIVIVNKHHGMQGEYIGRGSPLGNPFVIGVHGTRKEVIDKYGGREHPVVKINILGVYPDTSEELLLAEWEIDEAMKNLL